MKAKKEKAFFQDFTYGKTEKKVTTHNIIAVIPGKDKRLKHEYIVVGSHYDHLGMGGQGSGSRRPDTLGVHPGADDNASGDAVVLELAKYFKKARSPRSLVFMFFGAEEQGLVGSKQFLEWLKHDNRQRRNLPDSVKGIVAMVNLDMVGRMRDNALSVSGTGTSSGFKALAEEIAEAQNLHVSCVPDGYGPSDQASFVAVDIPVLFLTTGGHMEYHTPADVPSTLNYDGMQQTFDYTKELVSRLASQPQAPDYINVPSTQTMKHAKFKVTLGLMPDVMGQSRIPGLRRHYDHKKNGRKETGEMELSTEKPTWYSRLSSLAGFTASGLGGGLLAVLAGTAFFLFTHTPMTAAVMRPERTKNHAHGSIVKNTRNVVNSC